MSVHLCARSYLYAKHAELYVHIVTVGNILWCYNLQ